MPRDQLVVLDHDKNKLVREHLARGLPIAAVVEPMSLPAPQWRSETFAGLDACVDRWLGTPPEAERDPTGRWQATQLETLQRSKSASTQWKSVHEVASRERVARAASPVGVPGGNLVHEVMEFLDLSLSVDVLLRQVDVLIRSCAPAHGVDDERATLCADIVSGMLGHPVLERARNAPERWVEAPFSVRDGGRIVSGRIDLAFPVDARRTHWVVVDWKSDLPVQGTRGWRKYQRQLGWYAQALLKTVSPCEHVETVLVGPHPALGPGATAVDVLVEVHPELAAGLRQMLHVGLPLPRVGADVGEPIVAVAELAWDAERVALCVGIPQPDVASLRAQGWRVVACDAFGLTWAGAALAEVTALLGPPLGKPDARQ